MFFRSGPSWLRSASPQRTAYLNTCEQLAVSRFDFQRVAALYCPDGVEHVTCSDLRDRQLSERQKDVNLEAPQDVLRGLQLPLDDHCAVLVASHVFETVLRVQPGPACLLVLGTCQIGAGGQQLTCLVAPMPYVSKRDFREDSKAQACSSCRLAA